MKELEAPSSGRTGKQRLGGQCWRGAPHPLHLFSEGSFQFTTQGKEVSAERQESVGLRRNVGIWGLPKCLELERKIYGEQGFKVK